MPFIWKTSFILIQRYVCLISTFAQSGLGLEETRESFTKYYLMAYSLFHTPYSIFNIKEADILRVS